MATLVLVRHGESVWNKENRFTGWKDVDLSPLGVQEAQEAGRALRASGLQFACVFTSVLKRAIRTWNLLSEEADLHWLPTIKDWRLNERHYGELTGLNKAETAVKHGEDQVKIWRRSFDVPPPLMPVDHAENPSKDPIYAQVPTGLLPMGESLKDTIHRVRPTWEEKLMPRLFAGENILVVAHGNSLRAMIMTLEKMSPDEILNLNVPTGIPLKYELDRNFAVQEKSFLGDADKVATAIAKVAAQGKKK